MNNSMAVQVFNSRANLQNIALNFEFMKAFSTTKQFVKWLVLTQFKKDVNVFCIFEKVFKANNVVVVKRAVDFDFRHKFRFRSALS